MDELPLAARRRVADTDLTGASRCARAAFRLMREQDPQSGRIIDTGSVPAHAPRPHRAAYAATTQAVTGLTTSLSLDGRPYRVVCGRLDAGDAATAMTERMRRGVRQADGTPAAEPVMDVADVARTVRHVAQLPLEADVRFATVTATALPMVRRG